MIRLFIILLIFTDVANAVVGRKINRQAPTEQAPVMTVKEQATKEIHSLPIEKKQTLATPSVDSMLSFRDPKKEIITRSWKYYLSAGLQNFQPSGTVMTETGMVYQVGRYDEILLPQISLGATGPINEQLNYEFAGQFAFYSHAQPVRLPSGFAIDDSRFNTMMTTMKFGLGTTFAQKTHLNAGVLTGVFNLTQTSQNSFAQFSRNNQLNGFYTYLGFQFAPQWQTGLEYNQVSASLQNEVRPQTHNLQLNAKVLW